MKYKKAKGEFHLKNVLGNLTEDGEFSLTKVFRGGYLEVYKHDDTTYVVLPWKEYKGWLSFPIKERYEDIEGEEYEFKKGDIV